MHRKHYLKDNAWMIGLCVVSALACNLVFVHVTLWIIKELPNWHAVNMAGNAPAPLQFRVFSFYAPEVLTKYGFDIVNAYLAVRFASLALAFWFAAQIVRQFTSQALAPAMMVLALALYYAASTQPHFQPAEEPNLFFFALFLHLYLRGSSLVWLALVFLFGILNKDTVGFLIPFVFLHRWTSSRQWWPAVRDSAVLSAIFVVGYAGLRMYYGTDRPYLGLLWGEFGYNVNFFFNNPMAGSMWLLPSLLPMAYMLRNWKQVPLVLRCFFPSLLLFVLGHVLISRTEEFRTYTPLALLMWPGLFAMVEKIKAG